jgi:hypothetical protein
VLFSTLAGAHKGFSFFFIFIIYRMLAGGFADTLHTPATNWRLVLWVLAALVGFNKKEWM